MMLLSDLNPGSRVKLLDFGKSCAIYRKKLMALGLIQGVEITVVRIAPLGCPVQIEVLGTHLALRKEDMIHLRWERI